MANDATQDRLDIAFGDLAEIEAFLFPLMQLAATKKLKDGDDVLKLAREAKLKVPELFQGEEMVWDTTSKYSDQAKTAASSISITRPGNPQALGLTIGCIRRGKWRICLECGWIWCRIVISRRF